MKISSPAFEHQQSLPAKYTCDGENISPPLVFQDIPPQAKSLVLLMDDPDVPKNLKPDGMWDHWVLYNIPATTTAIEEGKNPQGSIGLNTSGQASFQGACPPNGEHRYFFKVYALDSMLAFDDPAKVTKQMVEQAMTEHIIDQAELIGLYRRK